MATSTHPDHANIPDWGIDRDPRQRPGVPRETPPHPVGGAHWQTPERQAAPTVTVLKRPDLAELTPVFSTAVPPHGLSGLMRRLAYRFPDHLARKWELLLIADRVDAIESAVSSLFTRRGR
jgi:hypothetical protein